MARCLRRREPSLSQTRILPGRPPRVRQRPRADAPDGAAGQHRGNGAPGATGADGDRRAERAPARGGIARATERPRHSLTIPPTPLAMRGAGPPLARTLSARAVRHADKGPAHSAPPGELSRPPCISLLQARVSCRLASRPRLRSPPDGSPPPTRSPCAAAAQAVWRPTRLLRPAPPQRPPHPPRRVSHPTAFCVDSDDAWRLRAGRSGAPLAH